MTFLRIIGLLAPLACLQAQQTFPLSLPGQASAAAPTTPPDKVVIAVDDVKLTAGDFERIVNSLPAQLQAQARGPNRSSVANNIVQMLVLAGEARREKMDQDPDFQFLAKFQTDNMLATHMAGVLSKNNKPDDAALHKYYDDHKADYEQARVSHILVRFQGSQAPLRDGKKDLTEAEALAKVQDLRKRIEGGEDFASVAKAESDDAASGAKGGDLGLVAHGQTVAAFEEAAFALKPGEISEPVKTQFGYHLIKLVSMETKTFDQVRPEIETKLGPPLVEKAISDLVKKSSVTVDTAYFPPPEPAK
ncbi:MAG TPA: peptidylprolyl isomerase [Bryobacteraceae bacterium]|nr:peptidylprolyl isomerase [Bryobacteraceae bacterium]